MLWKIGNKRMKYKILFKVDTELESDDNEEHRLLASYIYQRLDGVNTYLHILNLITNFYKELP